MYNIYIYTYIHDLCLIAHAPHDSATAIKRIPNGHLSFPINLRETDVWYQYVNSPCWHLKQAMHNMK